MRSPAPTVLEVPQEVELTTLAQRLRLRLERIHKLAIESEKNSAAIARLSGEALLDGLSIGCRICGGYGKVVMPIYQGTRGMPCWCNAIMDQREVGLDTGELAQVARDLRNELIKVPVEEVGKYAEMVPRDLAMLLLAEVKRLRANGPGSELSKLAVDSTRDAIRGAIELCRTIASENTGTSVYAGALACVKALEDLAR